MSWEQRGGLLPPRPSAKVPIRRGTQKKELSALGHSQSSECRLLLSLVILLQPWQRWSKASPQNDIPKTQLLLPSGKKTETLKPDKRFVVASGLGT